MSGHTLFAYLVVLAASFLGVISATEWFEKFVAKKGSYALATIAAYVVTSLALICLVAMAHAELLLHLRAE